MFVGNDKFCKIILQIVSILCKCPYMSLVKNCGGRVRVKEKLYGREGSKKFQKYLFRFMKITGSPKKYLKKLPFFTLKSNVSLKIHFFSKNFALQNFECGGG